MASHIAQLDRSPGPTARTPGRVAAVVMTYNRRERLRRWLECIQEQTISPAATMVVDNGSTDGSAEMIRREYSHVRLISLGENRGPSAAAAAGMQAAYEDGFDWIWMFDDDAFPSPPALQRALEVARRVEDPALGMVWLPFSDFGGWTWQGRKKPVSVDAMSQGGQRSFKIDQVDLNMTLISRHLMDKVGLPRAEFFIMLWSCDYCLRVAKAGFSIWVVPEVLVRHEHVGSDESGIWRSYYQTRNQLVMAIERRSPTLMFWWFVRQCRFVGGTLFRHDRKWQRIRLRMRGAWDAIRGAMGKRVDPALYVNPSAQLGPSGMADDDRDAEDFIPVRNTGN